MKTCAGCYEEKPLSDYYQDKSNKSGYKSKCKECIRARRKDRYREDPQKELQRNAVYLETYVPAPRTKTEEQKERARANSQRWRDRNKDRHNEYNREWNQSNPEKRQAYEAKRRGQLSSTSSVKLSAEWRKVISLMPCYYCQTTTAEEYHVDHRIPLARGGDDSWVNLVRSCQSCNNRKYTKTDAEFLGWS